LAYTLAGGVVLLTAILALESHTGPVTFVPGGGLGEAADALGSGYLRVVFCLFVIGLGVKAALVPLHGWLPVAMVAPAPVSALLHAVAVVKAGAFGLLRVVMDVFGLERTAQLGLALPLAAAAAFTVV